MPASPSSQRLPETRPEFLRQNRAPFYPLMRAFFCAVICALTSLFAPCASAAIVEVLAAERAASATQAKQAALTEAEQRAFKKWVEEQAPDQAKTILKSYDASHISSMVQGYEVVSETMTDTSYRARLKIDFNDDLLAKVIKPEGLEKAKAAVVKVASETAKTNDTILVLPVFRDGEGILLWDAGNQWRDALEAAAIRMSYDRLVLPFGDPTDRLMIDSGNVTTANYAMLSGMAARYGARQVLIAEAKPQYGYTPVEMEVDLTFLAPQKRKTHQFTSKDDDVGQVLTKAAQQVVQGIVREEASRVGSAALPKRSIIATVSLNRVSDWSDVRKRLEAIPMIEAVEVKEADWRTIQAEMHYRGAPEALGKALASANIGVAKSEGGLTLTLQ